MIIVNHYQNGLKIPDSWFLIPLLVSGLIFFLEQVAEINSTNGNFYETVGLLETQSEFIVGPFEMPLQRSEVPTTKWSTHLRSFPMLIKNFIQPLTNERECGEEINPLPFFCA